MGATERITGTISIPQLDSSDLRRTNGKVPQSSVCGSPKDGRHDGMVAYAFFLAVCVCYTFTGEWEVGRVDMHYICAVCEKKSGTLFL